MNGRPDVQSRDGDQGEFSKLLDRAEDPGETLDYSYERQLQLLQNVKRGVADVVTAKKRLQHRDRVSSSSLVKLDTQARQALAAGREDLARAALSASPPPRPSCRTSTGSSRPSRSSSRSS